ncbi:MAG: glycosyltransferase family 39 protein [Tepidisphaeraceae bacterium]
MDAAATEPQPAPPASPREAEDVHRRVGAGALAALLVIVLLAFALRVYRMDAKSFWFDEFQSVGMACGRGFAHFDLPANVVLPNPPALLNLDHALPWWQIWYGETQGHMPPLYPLLLRAWGEIFGLGETSARAFSVAASVAAIVALFFVVRELSGTTAALWAGALMALAGPQIQFGQEARNYTLLLLEALVAAAALVRIERRGPTFARAAMLSLSVLAMALTHYFAAGTILALAIYAAVRLRGSALRTAVASFVVAALLWLPLGGPVAWRHAHNVEDPRGTAFLRDDAPGHATRTLLRAATLPARFFTEPAIGLIATAAAGGIAFVLAMLMPLRRRDLLLWALWLPLTILPMLALDLGRGTQHLEFIRYTLLASPAIYALVAGALSTSRGLLRHVPPAVAVLSCLLALPLAYDVWWKANWRGFAASVDANVKPGDVTVFWAGNDFPHYPNAVYLHTSYYRRTPQGPIVLLRDPPDDATLRQLRAAPGVLLVALSAERLDEALPGAQFEWLAFQPGAGRLSRATWK